MKRNAAAALSAENAGDTKKSNLRYPILPGRRSTRRKPAWV
jgi:hypothetical protein